MSRGEKIGWRGSMQSVSNQIFVGQEAKIVTYDCLLDLETSFLELRNPTRLNFLVSLYFFQVNIEPRTRRGRQAKTWAKNLPWGGGGGGRGGRRKRPPTDIMIISSSLSPGILYRKRCFCGSIFRFLSLVYNG